MRRRGANYWLWVNSRLPMHSHDETLSDGLQIEVQARVGLSGDTQVFIGVYTKEGREVSEEFHDRGKDIPCEVALKWASERAREIVIDQQEFTAPHRTQTTLSTVVTDPTVVAIRRMEMSEYERLKLKASDAWSEYLDAKNAMLNLMRLTRVDPGIWAESKARLQQAIDRRVCIQRAYLR
ncbi:MULTISPECIES: hypothetical protein [unclassified Pseudomonas]|uniref:hypothetical protein n=1 Tax=unclassified Pseudomonas TaxID=196821 RepID=UPI00215D18B5|nr:MULTISPECIES: hypothetical protein [unclassified Pseudomonas]MCR8935307.1 hypothetical protein [Pseudomonas sp. S11A4]MCR8973572.1 hypothetical protein [Pseudomonas sp. S11P7]